MQMTFGRCKVALVLTALLLSACDQQTEAERVSQACGDDARSAYDMTKRFVAGNLDKKDRAKTASFPFLSDVRARKPDPGEPCAWLIYGFVDLEAGSGAVEQRRYLASLTYSGDNRWRVTDFRWQSLSDTQKAATDQ